jgi:general secretion pathway protein K
MTPPSKIIDAAADVDAAPSPQRRATRRAGRHFTQRGVALIAVTVALALTAVVVTDFSTNTTVDMRAAANIEADMQAHFLARSAMNLSELIIQVQTGFIDGLNEQLNSGQTPIPINIQIADYTGFFIGAFGGGQEEVADMAAMLGAAGGEIKGLGVQPGASFDVQIATDDGKINLNCAGDPAGAGAALLAPKLAALFYAEAYNPLFENEDAEGYRRDRYLQIEAIIDYIDRDRTKFDAATNQSTGGAPEEYAYETLRDKYEPRNRPMDTVGEIKLIRGIDDRFWKLFGGNFTVYGGCKENLTAITDPKQIMAIIIVTAKNPQDPVLSDPNKLWTLATLVIKARELGYQFTKLQDFQQFISDPMKFLESLGIDPSMLGTLLNLPNAQAIEGVELDATQLNKILRTGPRRTYRVEATARFDKLEKRIVGVWDKDVTRQHTRRMGAGTNPGGGQGAWVFWREE